MRDVELYRQVLGLEAPWTVTRVELSVTEERVDVGAGHAARVRWPCPTCGAELPVYDHAAERAWRHLDTCQFVTYLRGPRGSPTRTMVCGRCAGREPSPTRASHCCLSGWRSTC